MKLLTLIGVPKLLLSNIYIRDEGTNTKKNKNKKNKLN